MAVLTVLLTAEVLVEWISRDRCLRFLEVAAKEDHLRAAGQAKA
jgi:hypothetical protein